MDLPTQSNKEVIDHEKRSFFDRDDFRCGYGRLRGGHSRAGCSWILATTQSFLKDSKKKGAASGLDGGAFVIFSKSMG